MLGLPTNHLRGHQWGAYKPNAVERKEKELKRNNLGQRSSPRTGRCSNSISLHFSRFPFWSFRQARARKAWSQKSRFKAEEAFSSSGLSKIREKKFVQSFFYLVCIFERLGSRTRDPNFFLGLGQLWGLEVLDVVEPTPGVHKLFVRNFSCEAVEVENEWPESEPGHSSELEIH